MSAFPSRRGPYVAPSGAPLVRRLRVDLGLTQLEAAKRCAMSLRTYQRIEAGGYASPYVLSAMERALGVSL